MQRVVLGVYIKRCGEGGCEQVEKEKAVIPVRDFDNVISELHALEWHRLPLHTAAGTIHQRLQHHGTQLHHLLLLISSGQRL